ncbi:MAG: FtsW/RodA/SpoVE family cell cycle protein [Lachnospirales bacterium]
MEGKRRYKSYKSFDFILMIMAVSLSVFGIVLIGSATKINITGISSEFSSQIVWLGLGIIALLMASFIDIEFIFKFYILIYLFNLFLLVAVFFIGTADQYGVARWIRFGPVGIQPSELTKILLIIFFAKFLDNNKEKINSFTFIVKYALLLMLPIFLIAIQPSLSACLIPLIIGAVLLFEAGLDKRIVVSAIVIGVVVVVATVFDSLRENHIFVDMILTDYQIGRIQTAFLQEDAGDSFMQTGYAIQAIASGQMSGKGLYNGTVNQLNFIAESYNDFIFSVLGEEFGFVGCVTTLVIFFVLILRILYISYRAKSLGSKLVCIGVATMIFSQVFINVGVNTGVLPNTGMTLPFLSYGGSSLLINLASIGLVINVSMEKERSIFEG